MHAGTWCVPVLALVILLFPRSLPAQGTSHGYVSLGTGATDVSGGVDWLLEGGPVGIGAEAGIGWAFMAAIIASYHLFDRQQRKYDVFTTGGYAMIGSSEFSSNGAALSGGLTYWPARRMGVRFNAFRFVPVTTDNHTVNRSPSRYWGARLGLAFRIR